MLTLDLVTIDTTGWRQDERTPTNRCWNVGGDAIRFHLMAGPCLEDTVEGWRQRAMRETAQQGGTWLSFDEIDIDGCVAFQGVFKFPAARVIPQLASAGLAVYIVGLIAVPLGDVHLMLNTESLERGTTGQREAAYGVLQPKPTGEPQRVSSMEAFFDRVRDTLGTALPSDAPEFDALAPTHPLSRVRTHLRVLRSQLRFAPELRSRARPPHT
jgi:hypothetical protein